MIRTYDLGVFTEIEVDQLGRAAGSRYAIFRRAILRDNYRDLLTMAELSTIEMETGEEWIGMSIPEARNSPWAARIFRYRPDMGNTFAGPLENLPEPARITACEALVQLGRQHVPEATANLVDLMAHSESYWTRLHAAGALDLVLTAQHKTDELTAALIRVKALDRHEDDSHEEYLTRVVDHIMDRLLDTPQQP
jgi:hypothetical protein